MISKFKEVLTILSNLATEKTDENQINEIAKGQSLIEELEKDSENMKQEIITLKKDKIGFVKRLGAYKQESDDNNNDEKSLDDIIKEVANKHKENK